MLFGNSRADPNSGGMILLGALQRGFGRRHLRLHSFRRALPLRARVLRLNLWDDNSWISVGAGLRGQFITEPEKSGLNDAELANARLYIQGQLTKKVGFTYNTDIDQAPNGDPTGMQTLDAMARFEFHDEFNLYGGRMLPPSDRANLDGPFNLGTWEFPFVSAYPAIFDGRDNGGAVWGDIGKFKYMIGGYQGCTADNNSCFSREANGPLVAGRVQYDFWMQKTAITPTRATITAKRKFCRLVSLGSSRVEPRPTACGQVISPASMWTC